MSSRCHNSESGYTLQTLIIIAILVLGATTASVILYAVLRDSTSRIAGGSETFDGYPSGPQNLRVESVPGTTMMQTDPENVDVTIKWEAPSYLGEFPPRGYDLLIRNTDDDSETDIETRHCENPLEVSAEDFTYNNSCEVNVPSFDDTADYELVFTVNLGSADVRSSPGGLTFYRELNLSTGTPPPDSPQVKSLHEGVEISWDAVPNVVYRLHTESNGSDYYQCFESTGGMVTREVPNFRMRSGTQNNTTLTQKTEYTIEISASNSVPGTLGNTYCSTDSNFGRSVEITASFGAPSIPDITFETDLTRTVGSETLPSLKATLASCEADFSTTFFWEIKGQPATRAQHTITGCGTTPACTLNCALTVYDEFTLGTEYEVWAVAENTVGLSNLSERQRWLPTRASASLAPGPPQNINTVSVDSGTLVSWDAPALIPDAGIRGYILRLQEKPSSTACPTMFGATSTTLKISADTLQHRLSTQENHKTHCFQLSAFSFDSNQAELESEKEEFEAAYVNPLTIGTGEFLLNWYPDPSAKYYTIRWAPLAEDIACDNPRNLDLDDPARQPAQFLSETLIYDGEESMSYTIPAVRDLQYRLLFTAVLNDAKTYSWSRYVCSPP